MLLVVDKTLENEKKVCCVHPIYENNRYVTYFTYFTEKRQINLILIFLKLKNNVPNITKALYCFFKRRYLQDNQKA